MPSPRRPLLALASLAGLLAFGCARDRGASNKGATADPGGAPAPDDSAIAVVGGGELEPDPAQLAAGIPYLRFRIEIDDSPARGPADAPVTIVMFSDFQCSFCDEAFHTVSELQAEYPEQIRFVYKALPLDGHQHAMEAALVGHSAKAQGKFWEFHDLVFRGQGIDPATIRAYAREIGLDLDRVERELESLVYAPDLRRDLRVARRLKLTSTPVFFINGRMLPGARPKHIFRHYIDQELELAARLGDQGIAARDFYVHATQWGYTAIVYEGEEHELDEDKVYPVPIDDSPVRGPADAPITIIAFSDFQCPFCARGHETMEQLRALHGPKLRFVFKHFPLPGHPLGALASRASFAAAEAGKFWGFHDAVFALGGRYDQSDLLEIGDQLGIPRDKLEEAMTTEANDSRIEADIELGIRLRVSGTPAYFINGRPIVGALPLLDFRMLIVEELARADAK